MKKYFSRKRGKSLATIKIDNEIYSIRTTEHAEERMEQRDIDEYVVTGNILALGRERLLQLQETQEDAIIIDERKKVSIVICFVKNTITIITVIGTENIWNNRGTQIVRI